MTTRPVPEDSPEEPTEKSRRDGSRAGAGWDSIDTGETLMRQEVSLSGEHLPPIAEGRYQVDVQDKSALLGRGGQGTVWRAYDKVLRREVAIKKLHTGALKDPTIVSAFLREARLTALLEHPGIVPLHDVGRGPDGSLYLALRRIEGKSLADTLAAANGLDGRLALVPALVRACQAVAFAHERGVVHRDLKPQNVMLGRFGETYVLDWGLALIEHRAGAPDVTAPHQSTGVVGTPAYMSPEQALGLAADARSDVWGLGGCLYHLLTGQAPITGRSLKSAMGHAAHGEVSPVLAVEPDAPPDLAAICSKALMVERSERYPDAKAMAADLEAWLAGRTVTAHRYSRAELLRRGLGANRRMVGVVALGLCVLSGVLIFDELRVRRERNEARTYVRELIRELPREVEASRANIALINTLTARVQKWLSREDLTVEENDEACDVLLRLGSINADISVFPAARNLFDSALALAAREQAARPDDSTFFACEVQAQVGLGFVESETGDDPKAIARYSEVWRRLQAWRGERTPALGLAAAALSDTWGTWLWARDPVEARGRFLEASAAVLPLISSADARHRHFALGYGANAVAALWSEGKRPQALALARQFFDAAAADCGSLTVGDQRACRLPAETYASILLWEDAPEQPQVEALALAADAFVIEHDVDSASSHYQFMTLNLALGHFTQAAAAARKLRENGNASWALEMGPLAAVLAGDLVEVELWEPHLTEAQSAALLALGLRDVSVGKYADAARHLRAVKKDRLWYALSWAPHPEPKLSIPEVARPAFERFLTDFTQAYGAADMAELGASVNALAAAVEALP